ncbi:MAG: DUF1801 domain-containing protein [Spirochaetales bacterium]|nr:DUF1801 domain-containing protein [Spirochaetales bacterium]
MRIEAVSIEDLFQKSGNKEELIRLLDRIITEEAPGLERQFFSGPSITMIGYGEMPWNTASASGTWPVISLAPQKDTVNLYIAAEKEGKPLPSFYIEDFGKSAVGKSCVRIRSVKTLKKEALISLIRETVQWADAEKNRYGRRCAAKTE